MDHDKQEKRRKKEERKNKKKGRKEKRGMKLGDSYRRSLCSSFVATHEVVFLSEAVTLQSFQVQRPGFTSLTARNEEKPKKGGE